MKHHNIELVTISSSSSGTCMCSCGMGNVVNISEFWNPTRSMVLETIERDHVSHTKAYGKKVS